MDSNANRANQPSNGFSSDPPSNTNDSSGSEPASGAQSTQKYQGADRPNSEPNSSEHSRIQQAKAEAERAQDVDASGSGPLPLSGTYKAGGVVSPSDGDDDRPQKESHGTGTGEIYMKSTGTKADGGNFDAANPGAGKEANRRYNQQQYSTRSLTGPKVFLKRKVFATTQECRVVGTASLILRRTRLTSRA